jgi:uncharacterized membrane protein YagU involved in acid resistance
MNRLLIGAFAGLVATVPMTVVMKLLHKGLPKREQYPLPPRSVTMKVASKVGIKDSLDEKEKYVLTAVSHFAYGTATGALYAPLAKSISKSPFIEGASWGLAVWAGSYLGWLPAMGILRPATEHPLRRTAVMITAHLVWGGVVGLLVDKLEGRETRA